MAERAKMLGAAIRAARLAADMSQEELARVARVKRGTVSTWENGHHEPTPANLEDIAMALGMTVASLESLATETETSRGAARVSERAGRHAPVTPAPRIPPRAYQRIYERVELLEKAGVPEGMVDEARRLMSDETFNTMHMRSQAPKTEKGWLDDIDAAWAFIRETLGRKGFKL